MIFYKDMIFCSYYDKCVDGQGCCRALTECVRQDAQRRDLPVAQFVNPPKCFRIKDKAEVNHDPD